jgi:antitoxin component YwqK of YwqJK toxin-antitoxin module
MKKLLIIPVLIVFTACSEDNANTEVEIETTAPEVAVDSTDKTEVEVTQNPVQNEPGLFQEFYPNGALKMEGKNDENGLRNGLWIAYYENGKKWSESYYVKGKKSGHSLSFYPNGNVRYVGEYLNDEKIGTWKFYDENGDLSNEETF